jgi:DNA-directed RNA polymerase subunit RPC12/RpoP
MICPSCSSEMTHLANLGARLGATVDIDLCHGCRAIWFDRYEDLQMAPAATLKVFSLISEPMKGQTQPLTGQLRCPRCQARLLMTHDMQRNTAFKYWRCNADHGRLMAYIDFLRAKDFVRPLTPQQLAELRQNVQTINCSNCGASINLTKDSACAYCGSAVSMLDLRHMAQTIGQLQNAVTAQAADAPAPAASPPAREIPNIDALMMKLRAEKHAASGPNLIEMGLGLLGDLLRKRR